MVSGYQTVKGLVYNFQKSSDGKAPALTNGTGSYNGKTYYFSGKGKGFISLGTTSRNQTVAKIYDSAKVSEVQIHALNTLVTCHNVARYLNFAPLLPHIRDLDRECTDMVLYILAGTGDPQYAAVIRQEAERFPDLPQEEYMEELRAQSCGKD